MKPWEKDDTFLARWLSGELSEDEKRNFEASEESKEFADLVIASKALEIPKYDVEKALKDVKSRQQQQQATTTHNGQQKRKKTQYNKKHQKHHHCSGVGEYNIVPASGSASASTLTKSATCRC